MSPLEPIFQFLDHPIAHGRSIGAATGAKTGLDLIAFDLILHTLDKTSLAGREIFQADLSGTGAGSLLFDAFPNTLSDKEGDF